MEPIALYKQERIRQKVDRDISQDRLASSIIFYGLPGLGKERMAFYLAQSLLCRSSDAGACGECNSCRKVERLLHPDVQWLYPRPGSLTDEELEKVVELKSSEDFFRPTFTKTTSHAIDAIRNLRSISGKKPYEGSSKVFIVSEADRMTTEAANAFLKLLEEPPDDTLIVLTTSRLHALLPTIRSRCEEVRLSTLPLEETRRILVEELDVPEEPAEQIARNSEGSLGRAVRMWKEGGDSGWEDAWNLFELAVRGSEGDRYAFVVDGPLKKDGERFRAALEVLTSILRDLLVVDLGLGKEDVINVSRFDILQDGGNLPVNGVIRSVKLIEEIRRLLDRNLSNSILLWRLLNRLSTNLKSV